MLYKHNAETYNKITPILIKHRKCALLQATGTGKSFIAIELLQTLFRDLRVLWVVPRLAIEQGIKLYDEWNFDNVEFALYDNLDNYNEHEWDVLILDELHRAGAPTWKKKVDAFIPSVKYLFGMSATPYRFLDNKRDMALEIFDKDIVWGPDIDTAVKEGILPAFDYAAIMTESFEVGANIEVRKIVHLDMSETQMVERIKKYIRPDNRKWLVFYPNKNAVESADEDLYNWFGDTVHIYAVHSGQTRKRSKQELDDFNNDTGLCVLKSVDMVSEGVHLKGVTGVIFARATQSGNVFIQQIGRALSASNKTVRPTIIDLVGNYNNIKVLSAYFPEVKVRKVNALHGKEVQHTEAGSTEIYVSYDDTLLELNEVLVKVKDVWTDVEDAIIRRYYLSEGGEVYRRIPGKSKTQCLRRARVLGLSKVNKWTPEEDAILMRYYPSERNEVWRRLSGRSQAAIERRADKLGLLPKWLPEEDLILMKRWETERFMVDVLLPRHNLTEIVIRAKKLGLEK